LLVVFTDLAYHNPYFQFEEILAFYLIGTVIFHLDCDHQL
jgi:hypothetical protein